MYDIGAKLKNYKSRAISMKELAVTTSGGKEKSTPTVAVVICTHNRPVLLERCLQRLAQIEEPDFATFVIDSAPNSSETKSVAARHDVQYCLSPRKGLSRARNIGIRAA